MSDIRKKKLRRATIIYWILLSYIVAALLWWLISLERQNSQMREFRVHQLSATVDSLVSPELYKNELTQINAQQKRDRAKHVGEGIVFLALILFGASFIFRSVRRQFRVQAQQQNFMMAVTHELKTPIAVVKLNLETLQRHQLEPDKQKRLITKMLEETGRLNFLTNNILLASQLEGGGYRFAKDEMNFSDLVQDSINDFQRRFPDRTIGSGIQPEVEIKGDALLLQMLVNNLVENALKYSPADKRIDIRLEADGSTILLQVIDEGAGVPDEEKKKIFTRFYRIGNESTRKTPGTGLGLYLCSKIAKDHNADISVTNHNPQGSNFAVKFHT